MKIKQNHIHNVCMLAGWGMVSFGAGMVYLPAGLIVGGCLLMTFTAIATRVATKG